MITEKMPVQKGYSHTMKSGLRISIKQLLYGVLEISVEIKGTINKLNGLFINMLIIIIIFTMYVTFT